MRFVRPFILTAVFMMSALALAACGQTATPTPTATATASSAGQTPQPTPTASTGQTSASTGTPTPSSDAASYFKGKTVNFVVAFSPGGGYDVFSRIVAKVLPKYLPGNPRVVVSNVTGSGGQVGLTQVMKAPPNGLTVTIVHPRFIERELVGINVPSFDLNTVNFIGAVGAPITDALYVNRKVATSWSAVEALGRPITVGQTSPGSTAELGARFASLLGAPIKMVYGYGGTAEIAAAFDRGELDAVTSAGAYNVVPRLYPDWMTNHTIVPLFWWGPSTQLNQEPDVTQFTDWMNQLGSPIPPNVMDVVHPTTTQRAAYNLAVTVEDEMSRLIILPPGVPDGVVNAWRQAVKEVANDSEFKQLAGAAGYDTGYGDPIKMRQDLNDNKSALQDPAALDMFKTLVGGVS